jgi:hypothetical protein
MPEQLRRYKRFLTAEEARELIRVRIRAGLPVTAGDIRALGYSLENARWSAYRREVELELGIPHRRNSRVRSTVPVTVGSSESESNPPTPISVISPIESMQLGASPMQMPVPARGHISHGALAVAKQMFSALTRHSVLALYSLLSQIRRAHGQLRAK